MEKKLKLALIGCQGHVGYVIRVLKDLPELDLCAVSSGSSAPADTLVKISRDAGYDVRVYDDYIKMLDTEKPDIVSVCGPFELHARMCCDCLERNIHVFCETDDPVYYDGRFIAIHANTSGEKVLTLPESREWFDLFRNKAASGKSKTLKLKMERGQTEIFFIGSKADAERYQKMEQ